MSAVLGDRLRLPCSVLPRPGPCQWTKNGFGLGTDPELAAYTRYSMDSCDLVLDPVQAEDEAEYQCQAGVRRSPPVRVRVHQQPGPPHILQAKYGDLVEAAPGEVVRLECETQGGKPGADIVWRHGDGSKVEAEVMDIVTRMEDERQFRTRSVLKMVPEAAEETVYCEASSAVFPAARQSPPVRIRVRGQMAASLEFSKEEVEVGDTVDATCRVENENSILTYTWFINNVEMTEEKADTIRLENVAPHHHKLRIKCAVESSSGGRAEAERPLVVTAPLRLVERPGRVLASPGDTVTLRCRAEGGAGGGPQLSYVWTRVSDHRLLGVGTELSLRVAEDTAGEVSCAVIAGRDTDTGLTARGEVIIKQPPIVTAAEAVAYVSLADTAVLSCLVQHHYEDTELVWTRAGEVITGDGEKHNIVSREDGARLRSDLVILSVAEADLATYTCSAATKLGSSQAEVRLEVEGGSYTVISVILNILGLVFVLGVVSVIVIRRRAARGNVEYMEEEKRRSLHNQIFRGDDLSPFDKLLAIKNNSLANKNFNVDMEFKYESEDEVNESSKLNLKKPRRINRFYSAPNGSFQSDNTVISFINDED